MRSIATRWVIIFVSVGIVCGPVTAAQPAGEAALDRLAQVRSGAEPPEEWAALVSDVEREAGVIGLERAIDTDARFTRDTNTRTRALRALASIAFGWNKGGMAPDADVAQRVENRFIDRLLRRAAERSDREFALRVLEARIRESAPEEQVRLTARLRALRDSDDPYEVATYLTSVLRWVENPGPEDAEWALRLISRPETFAPKVSMALRPGWRPDTSVSLLPWALNGDESTSLRLLAAQARWDMGHMADDLALLDGLPQEQRQAAYQLLLRRLQREDILVWSDRGGREWLADDALLRVLRHVEAHYKEQWQELGDWYVPGRLIIYHAYLPERPAPLVAEVIRVERTLAVLRARQQDTRALEAVDRAIAQGPEFVALAREEIAKRRAPLKRR